MKKLVSLGVLGVFLIGVLGCSTPIKKVEIGEDKSPEEIMVSLENQKQKALVNQSDLLSRKNFKKAVKWSSKTEKQISKKTIDMEKILNAAGYSQAYFDIMFRESEKRKNRYLALLRSRRMALTAGVRNHPTLADQLKDVDKKVRRESNSFEKDFNAERFAELQKEYLKLEVAGVQKSELARANSLIEKARKNEADSKAPHTYNYAKKEISIAENAIFATPRSPELFAGHVLNARSAALKLDDVMAVIETNGGDLDERVAVQLVNTNRKIGAQDARISKLYGSIENKENQLSKVQTELFIKDTELSKADRKLARVSKNVKYQKVMDQFKEELSPEDGEIFQKGDSLVIRLKKINFLPGKKDLPESSRPLIAKVSSIVDSLDPSLLSVNGHTDSTGSEVLNKSLSIGRAEVVAKYLKSKKLAQNINVDGLGSSEPLASNKTAAGRAQNRRVDIIIESIN